MKLVLMYSALSCNLQKFHSMTPVTDSGFHAGFNIVQYLATTAYEQMCVKYEVSYFGTYF